MPEVFIPGLHTDITIGGQNFTLIGNVVSYSEDTTAVPKPTFGKRYRRTIQGQKVYTIDVSGHLAAVEADLLWVANITEGTVTWSIQIGEVAGPTDTGVITGDAVITNMTWEADAEGNWSWSMTLEGDDEPDWTPVAGGGG